MRVASNDDLMPTSCANLLDAAGYWEMVIVLRKVLIMCVFLMLERLPAVLLATFITIAALSIHIAARPFEDNGTDWAEMLSLAAQLLILTAGPVFIVLVRQAVLHPEIWDLLITANTRTMTCSLTLTAE